MPTRLEMDLALAGLIRRESENKYPALDSRVTIDKWLGKMESDSRLTARILIQMWPEVVRVRLAEGEKGNGSAKA